MSRQIHPTLDERLRARTDRSGGPDACWPWTAGRFAQGYGRMIWDGRAQKAHRVAWESVNGPIPPGLLALHHCDNPPCVNPAHIYIGTHADNAADRDRRGRNRSNPAVGEAAGPSKLTDRDVVSIRHDPRLQSVIAADYGVDQSAISLIKRRRTWRHIP